MTGGPISLRDRYASVQTLDAFIDAALADRTPMVDLRVLARDAHPDLMDVRLTHGTRAVPVVIVLDEHFVEIGWWGPRPAALQAWATLPDARRLSAVDRYVEIRRWYARDRGRTTLHEVLGVVAKRPRSRTAPAASTRQKWQYRSLTSRPSVEPGAGVESCADVVASGCEGHGGPAGSSHESVPPGAAPQPSHPN
jgi:hypothetical protein